MQYDFRDFSISLDNVTEIERFNDINNYYGVIFKEKNSSHPAMKYQLIHNLQMGYRLYMYNGEGYLRDIPFHKGTEGFLPEGVEVTWRHQ